jgi:hypothetical protein
VEGGKREKKVRISCLYFYNPNNFVNSRKGYEQYNYNNTILRTIIMINVSELTQRGVHRFKCARRNNFETVPKNYHLFEVFCQPSRRL